MADSTGDGDGDGDGDADTGTDTDGGIDAGVDAETITADGTTARYYVADGERVLEFERAGATAAIAQNVEGYAMLKVRPTVDGDELERYYGFDMALDHAAELLGVSPSRLPVPGPAADMGM
jgi:hypothetical protein